MNSVSTKKLVLVIACVVAIIGAGWGALSFVTGEPSVWYTRVDNTAVSEVEPHNDMKYRYELTVYNDNGDGRTVAFLTSRTLRDGALLKIEILPMRGVVSWEEAQPEQLPAGAAQKLGASQG